MTTPPMTRPRRSIDAIVFDLVLIGFSSAILVAALGLRRGAGDVPIIVAVPTLLGGIYVLVRDLWPRAVPAKTEEERAVDATSLRSLLAAAVEEDEEGVEVSGTPQARRRQLAFAAWTFGLVLLSALTSFWIAVPVALVVVLVAVRLPWIPLILTVAGTLILTYVLFTLFLNVRFPCEDSVQFVCDWLHF